MGTGVQGLKHAAKVQEWSVRIAECRGSGIGVKAWCREHGTEADAYVIRDGQKLTPEEVMEDMTDE